MDGIVDTILLLKGVDRFISLKLKKNVLEYLRNPEFNHVTLKLPFAEEVTLKIGQKRPKCLF